MIQGAEAPQSGLVMFTLLSGAYEQWMRKLEYNVLILGLDGAGKTVSVVVYCFYIELINVDVARTIEGSQ